MYKSLSLAEVADNAAADVRLEQGRLQGLVPVTSIVPSLQSDGTIMFTMGAPRIPGFKGRRNYKLHKCIKAAIADMPAEIASAAPAGTKTELWAMIYSETASKYLAFVSYY